MSAARSLDTAGLLVTRVNTGEELLDFAEFGQQSAIVFDMDLPDMKGLELMRQLRDLCRVTPIFVLTSNDNWDHVSRIYDLGADAVLRDTGDARELVARIKSAVRRVNGHANGIVQIGDMTVDTQAQTVALGAVEMRLTRKEYEIVELLSLRRETLVSRDVLLNQLYAWDDEPDAKIINVYLCRIRNQIAISGGDPNMLETVWGMGYRLNALAPASLPIAA